MKTNNESYEKISEALDTSFKTCNEIVKTKKEVKDLSKDEVQKDYDKIRKNLYGLLGDGKEAIDGILKVATEGDSPRAYEVVGQLLKAVSEINRDIMDLHKQVKEVTKEENVYNQNTTNAIYVGSTSELQDLINPERSRTKIIDVDHEVKQENDN